MSMMSYYKRCLILVLFAACFLNAFSQTRRLTKNASVNPYLGLAAGQETFISVVAPKMGDFVEYKHLKYPKFKTYYGADCTIGMFFGFWFSATAYGGFRAGPLSLDNSIAYLGLFPQGLPSRHQMTYNPKLGLKLGHVWLKSGPSVLFTHQRALKDFLKIGEYYYNFEIIFVLEKFWE